MKIYLFDPENGLYEGETFDESGIISREEGITAVAPPDYKHGQVPIFDRNKEAWSVLPIPIVRQLLKIRAAAEEKHS